MPFDLRNPMGSLQDVTETLANVGMEKAREALAQVNLLLQLLQSAGYGIESLEIEISVPPTITIKLKASPAVKEEKLSAIVREYPDKKVITGIVSTLIQANKLRSSVTVETLELEEVQIILTTTPNISLQWKDKSKKDKSAA